MRASPEVEAGGGGVNNTIHSDIVETIWVDHIATEDALLEDAGEDVTIDILVLGVRPPSIEATERAAGGLV